MSQFEREFAEYDPYAVLELDRVSNCKRIEMKKFINKAVTCMLSVNTD